MSNPDETPLLYTLRFAERARRDLDAATVRYAEAVTPEAAVAWREGLYQALASLTSFPRRCPLAPDRFWGEVRQLIYRHPGSSLSHRILFATVREEQGALDAPAVVILHVRHGAARAITRAEARRIESLD